MCQTLGAARVFAVRPFQLALSLALMFTASLPAVARAETLREIVSAMSGNQVVVLPAEVVGGAEIATSLTLVGPVRDRAVLTAPEDPVILTVGHGARVEARGLVFRQAGVNRQAVVVNGGELHLSDCRFEGAFETAVLLLGGSLTISDCSIEGAARGLEVTEPGRLEADGLTVQGGAFGIKAYSHARLGLRDVALLDQSTVGLSMEGPAEANLRDVRIVGAGGTGLGLDPARDATIAIDGLDVAGRGYAALSMVAFDDVQLRRVVVRGTWERAAALERLGRLEIDGAVFETPAEAIELYDCDEFTLKNGRFIAGDGSVIKAPCRKVSIVGVEVVGGYRGIDLPGRGDVLLSDVRTAGQKYAGVDLSVEGRLRVEGARLMAGGDALPLRVGSAGQVEIVDSVLVANGPRVIVTSPESAARTRVSRSVLVAAPEGEDTRLVPVALPGQEPPVLLPAGPVAPVPEGVGLGDSIVLSTAELVDLPGLDRDLGAELLAGFSGAAAPTRVPLAALESARLAAFTAREVRRARTPRQHVVELAPPEPGWRWSEHATEVQLIPVSGPAHVLEPRDFPYEAPEGYYTVRMDGRDAGHLMVAGPATLSLPLPAAPFFAWRGDDGTKVRGQTLYLRPAAELAALIAGMDPAIKYPAFAPRRGADLAEAEAVLKQLRAELPDLPGRYEMAAKGGDQKAGILTYATIELALDLFATFGTAEDAAWLLSREAGRFSSNVLRTAVRIESRLGIVGNGSVLAKARRLAASVPAADADARAAALTPLLAALALADVPDAPGMLADELRRTRAEGAVPFRFYNQAPVIPALARASPAVAGDILADFLDQVEVLTRRALEGTASGTRDWRETYIGIDDVVLALAAEARDGAPARRIPIVKPVAAQAVGWVFADPVRFVSGIFGQEGPMADSRVRFWQMAAAGELCQALALRAPEERPRIHAGIRDAVVEAVLRSRQARDPDMTAEALAHLRGRLRTTFDLVIGDCMITAPVLRSWGEDAEKEDDLLDRVGYNPPWWIRKPYAERQMRDFAAGTGHFSIDNFIAQFSVFFGPYPEEVLLRGLGSGERAYPELVDIFLRRHRLLNDGLEALAQHFTFGSEPYLFRFRTEGGNGALVVAGRLLIRPLADGDRLIVAIHHEIRSRDNLGGIAAAIGAPDRAPWEADHRRRMFETITLDVGGVETAMEHAATGADGVHYFTAPWGGTLDNTVLHLAMRYQDIAWAIDVPLWNSALARELRAEGAKTGDGP